MRRFAATGVLPSRRCRRAVFSLQAGPAAAEQQYAGAAGFVDLGAVPPFR
jgi:hypothetical protein